MNWQAGSVSMGIAALVRIPELARSRDCASTFRSSPDAGGTWAGAVACDSAAAAGASAVRASVLRVIFILNIIGSWLAG